MSNTVSTVHHGHHWEGILLNTGQQEEYLNDKKSMQKYAMPWKISADGIGESLSEVYVMEGVQQIGIGQESFHSHRFTFMMCL